MRSGIGAGRYLAQKSGADRSGSGSFHAYSQLGNEVRMVFVASVHSL